MVAFGRAAQESAKHYYDYLCSQNGTGKIVSDVSEIEKIEEKSQVFFCLRMRNSLVFWEAAQVMIDDVEYDTSKIQLIDYDEEEKTLRIVAHTSEVNMLLVDMSSERVKVISDLKFLVKRVQRWYMQYGDMLELPTSVYFDESKGTSANDVDLSQQQEVAVKTALTTPFSYIWGAPGTGKTKRVLAQCIIRYMKKKEPIIIVAPTNNAIEQILRGILPILKEKSLYSCESQLCS